MTPAELQRALFDALEELVAKDRYLLEHDLRHAISRNQLHVVYQPQVNIESGVVTGFEALLRWDHPERGAISPSVFIPIAEESGLILQIGEWVLRTACTEAATWSNPLSIAINVSGDLEELWRMTHPPVQAARKYALRMTTSVDPGL